MIQLNASVYDIEDDKILFSLVERALNKHLEIVRNKWQRDFDYYNGVGKEPHQTNKAKYIDDMSNSLFISIPPEFSTFNTDDSEAISKNNKKLKLRGFGKTLYDVGSKASICGTGFLLTYNQDSDEYPRFVSLDPLRTNVCFNCDVEPDSLFGFTFVQQVEKVNSYEDNTYYKIYVYTDKYMYTLRTISTKNLNVFYYYPIKLEEDILRNKTPHYFGKVPITAFKNNDNETGDSFCVYGLIDAYNHIREDAIKNIDDVIDYILFLKNVRIGNDEELGMFKKLLDEHIIAAEDIDGKGVDAKFLTNPLSQNDIQTMLDSISNDIHTISRVPNFSSETFAQNASSIALQLKLLGFLNLANEKERCFDQSLIRVLKMINNYLKFIKNDEYTFEVDDIEITYTHNLPSNDTEMVTQIVNLHNVGLLDEKEGLKQLSWVKDYETFYENAKKEQEMQKLVVDNLKKFNNNEREEEPMRKEQMDNLQNFSKGLTSNNDNQSQ